MLFNTHQLISPVAGIKSVVEYAGVVCYAQWIILLSMSGILYSVNCLLVHMALWAMTMMVSILHPWLKLCTFPLSMHACMCMRLSKIKCMHVLQKSGDLFFGSSERNEEIDFFILLLKIKWLLKNQPTGCNLDLKNSISHTTLCACMLSCSVYHSSTTVCHFVINTDHQQSYQKMVIKKYSNWLQCRFPCFWKILFHTPSCVLVCHSVQHSLLLHMTLWLCKW